MTEFADLKYFGRYRLADSVAFYIDKEVYKISDNLESDFGPHLMDNYRHFKFYTDQKYWTFYNITGTYLITLDSTDVRYLIIGFLNFDDYVLAKLKYDLVDYLMR